MREVGRGGTVLLYQSNGWLDFYNVRIREKESSYEGLATTIMVLCHQRTVWLLMAILSSIAKQHGIARGNASSHIKRKLSERINESDKKQ